MVIYPSDVILKSQTKKHYIFNNRHLDTNSPKIRFDSLDFLIFNIRDCLCNGDKSGPPRPTTKIDFFGALLFFIKFAFLGVFIPYRMQLSETDLENDFLELVLFCFCSFQVYFIGIKVFDSFRDIAVNLPSIDSMPVDTVTRLDIVV
jgi:hypothetical protein